MKFIHTALIAASLVMVAATAQAQVLTNIHGGAASDAAPPFGPQTGAVSDQARGAFAHQPVRVQRHRPHR